MAEKIVSPGVFTQEKDLSFLPIGVGEIGAAIIGPTLKGPAFVPTVIESQTEFETIFGPVTENYYTPYAVKNYLKSAGRVTVIRILGLGGYTLSNQLIFSMGGSVCSVMHPTSTTGSEVQFSDAVFTAAGTKDTFLLTLVGDNTYSCSFDTASANYITKVFGTDPHGANPIYVHKNFEVYQTLQAASTDVSMSVANSLDYSYTLYQAAETPLIRSQAVGGTTQNLFKFVTLDHGDKANKAVKVGISNIKRAGTIAGSDYGTFNVVVRGVYDEFGSTDSVTQHDVKETFYDCNLDPDSANYIGRKIGDQYVTIDTAVNPAKINVNGDYPNKSNHIRVSIETAVKTKSISPSLVPVGHAPVITPTAASGSNYPTASFIIAQISNGEYRPNNVYFGFDYDNKDSVEYLSAVTDGNSETGSNVAFSLENMYGHADATGGATASQLITLTNSLAEQRKFLIPFQKGFDGSNPAVKPYVGSDIATTNVMGFDCSTSSTSGSVAYRRALSILSNADEFDINMIVTPGILLESHTNVCTKAKDVCEDRGDCFYVMDGFDIDTSVASAIVETNVTAFDSSYTATYYPWVKILDTERNKFVWVPPSVVLPGVIAYNDQVAHEWFAPAGLNRGGLTDVLETKTRLTHGERDDLYEARINPIATFPQQGVVVWGQKTLQGKPSALDRVSVRRLLIALKKFIASSSKYLVFEQNTNATRNRFLNIVNPYLESVQQNSGLTAFKVVMDDTNNTPDVVDRNILYGQIFIQPTRTAEFIVLDFNIQPTGATFPTA